MRLMRSAPNRPRVSGDRGTWMLTTSESRHQRVQVGNVARLAGGPARVVAHPHARRRRRGMRRPGRCRRSRRVRGGRQQGPCPGSRSVPSRAIALRRRDASAAVAPRQAARIKSMATSAVAASSTPGVLQTATLVPVAPRPRRCCRSRRRYWPRRAAGRAPPPTRTSASMGTLSTLTIASASAAAAHSAAWSPASSGARWMSSPADCSGSSHSVGSCATTRTRGAMATSAPCS